MVFAKMNKRTTRLILILSAIASIVGFALMFFVSDLDNGPKLGLGGSDISKMAAIFYLWPSSSITQKKIWKFMIGAVIITALGSFLHQHSSTLGAFLTLIGYSSVIGLIFLKNKRKSSWIL